MANVDLVDLLPILKAILKVKGEYKVALDTDEVDFGVYPTLTENFLDNAYNQGYVVGFKQAWNEYLGTLNIDIAPPRELREVVPTNFSDSGSYDYDTLTSIMYYCLRVRQQLKTILDLDTDLFELYPPRLLEMSLSQYTAGVNDGYIDGINKIGQTDVTPPEIVNVNNTVVINTTFPGAKTYYMIGMTGEWTLYDNNTYIPIPENTRLTVYAYSVAGTKESEVVSEEFSYDNVFEPTITFENNIINIISNYFDSSVKIKYKLSSWENYSDFIDYDGMPIPITDPTMVWAYNEFEDGSVSDTVSLACNPTSEEVVRPATPQILYSPENQVITINCSTPNAIIYYRKEGTSNWTLYNGAFKIIETGTYTTFALLDGIESYQSEPVTCNVSGTESVVYAPTIIPNSNNVSVFTPQTGVTLYIKNLGFTDSANNIGAGQWVRYNAPFLISMTNQYQAKAVLNSDDTKYAYSTITECKYTAVNPGGNTPGGGSGSSDVEYIAAPIVYYTNGVVSMTAVTAGSVVKYRVVGTETWFDYTLPFTISESTIYEAKAVKNGNESTITTLNCIIDGEGTMTVVMDFTRDILTLTTNVSGGMIYYRTPDSDWTVYTEPISVTKSDYYLAKVVKNGVESDIFGRYCKCSDIDYHDVDLTIVLKENGYVSLHTDIGSSIHNFGSYLNRFGRWTSFPINDSLYWEAETPLLIRGGLTPEIVNSSSNKNIWINVWSKKYQTTGEYVIWGNSASLFSNFGQGGEIPHDIQLILKPECVNRNGFIWYPELDWKLIVQHNEAPSIPDIIFDENSNYVYISSDADATIQYKIDDGNWIEYNYPFSISSDCIIYAKAYNIGNSILEHIWSEEASLECDIDEIIPTIEDCIISEPELGTVNITCSTPDVDIYYKLSNEEEWTEYTGTLHLDSPNELTVRPEIEYNGNTIYGNTVIKPVCDPTKVPYIYASCHSNIVSILRIASPQGIEYKKTTDSEWTTTYEDAVRFIIEESCTYQIRGHIGNVYNEFTLECVYEEEDYYNQPFTIELIERDSYIKIPINNNTVGSQNGGLYYKVNDGNWIKANIEYPLSAFNQRFNLYDKVSFKGQDTHDITITNTIEIYDIINEEKVNTKFKAYGNVSSMNYTMMDDNIVLNSGYPKLFMNSYITDASNLYFNALTMDSLTFSEMFKNCIYLTQAPNIDGLYNVNTIGRFKSNVYNEMFSGCTSLVTTPKLSDTYSCRRMFYNCTSLTTITNLPTYRRNTAAQHNDTMNFKYMFSGCTSIINTPLIIFVEIGNNYGKTNVTFDYMFSGCTSLTRTLHIVWAVGSGSNGTVSFGSMFMNCSNISYAKQLQNVKNSGWLSGVSATGTFVKKSGVTWSYGIPSGWTVISV